MGPPPRGASGTARPRPAGAPFRPEGPLPRPFRPRRHADRPAARAAAAALLLAACGGGSSAGLPPVACAAAPGAPGTAPADTLLVTFRLDGGAPPAAGRLLVRVDPFAESEMIAVEDGAARAPRGAGVGVALTLDGIFQGCFAHETGAVEVRTPGHGLAKAWMQVATERPVRVRVAAGGETLGAGLVAPGASGVVPWGPGGRSGRKGGSGGGPERGAPGNAGTGGAAPADSGGTR